MGSWDDKTRHWAHGPNREVILQRIAEKQRFNWEDPEIRQHYANNHYIDGRSLHPLYACWYGMHYRCERSSDPTYCHYGGRGITVCEEWNDFWAFAHHVMELEHYGEPGYSFDRIDNDGNYEPGNVRWADASTQAQNSRRWVDENIN